MAEIFFEEIMVDKFPKPGERTRHTDSGSPESSNWDELKGPTPKHVIIKI